MCARAGARGIHTNSRIRQHVHTYHVGSWPPPLAFPSKGLGHQSTMSKKKRLLLDLSRCIKLNAFANPSEVAMDYVPVLRHRLCAPLLADAADGVPTTLKMMDEYLLSKDELETITSELRLADIKVDGKATEVSADMYAKVDSKVKAALTRGYNKESHTVKFIKPKMGAAMMSKGKTTKAVGRSGEEKESDDDYVDDDEGTTLSAPVCVPFPAIWASGCISFSALLSRASMCVQQRVPSRHIPERLYVWYCGCRGSRSCRHSEKGAGCSRQKGHEGRCHQKGCGQKAFAEKVARQACIWGPSIRCVSPNHDLDPRSGLWETHPDGRRRARRVLAPAATDPEEPLEKGTCTPATGSGSRSFSRRHFTHTLHLGKGCKQRVCYASGQVDLGCDFLLSSVMMVDCMVYCVFECDDDSLHAIVKSVLSAVAAAHMKHMSNLARDRDFLDPPPPGPHPLSASPSLAPEDPESARKSSKDGNTNLRIGGTRTFPRVLLKVVGRLIALNTLDVCEGYLLGPNLLVFVGRLTIQ